MAHYLVETPVDHPEDWQTLAAEAHIHFTDTERAKGVVLMGNNPASQRERMFLYMEMGDPLLMSDLRKEAPNECNVPTHPIALMALALGMSWNWKNDNRVWQHMPRTIMFSPYILAHPNGECFVFLIQRDDAGLFGTWKEVAGNFMLSAMHVWECPQRNADMPKPLFHRGPDGLYQHY